MTKMTPEGWAQNSHEIVSQTRKWAETLRGISVGSVRGVVSSSQELQESTVPFFDMVSKSHDQMLDMWENGAHAFIDQATKMSSTTKL
jgi:hypothetical protein